MSADAWKLSTHEFRLLWESDPSGAPYPQTFAYGSVELFPDADARRLAEKQIRKTLDDAMTRMKATALETFHRPTLSVDIIGAASSAPAARRFRAHGTWRAGSEMAYVATQESTNDLTIGGAVRIASYPLGAWTSALLSTLPHARSAGRLPSDTAVPVKYEPLLETSVTAVSSTASTQTAAAAFVHLGCDAGAVLTLRAGSLADRFKPTTLEVHVADIDGDGRYALLMDNPATALPVDDAGLIKLVNKTLNAVRDRHGQRSASV
ncbi:hypothetical protein GCM10009619_09540 [Williamsia maris]|uniref:ESAT-6 protein secretion system EspG family protein n=1 Tax=Williamsia maris TaxID=72806 RepID=A0ABT1HBR9_9NOCA|nr:hypothetical protein [Williamsia maris]